MPRIVLYNEPLLPTRIFLTKWKLANNFIVWLDRRVHARTELNDWAPSEPINGPWKITTMPGGVTGPPKFVLSRGRKSYAVVGITTVVSKAPFVRSYQG